MIYLTNVIEQLVDRMVRPAIERTLKRESRNIEKARQYQALIETAQFVDRNFPLLASSANRFDLLASVIQQVADPTTGLVCEFGVWQGATVNYIAGCLPQTTVYGFDSFEGLPEDWRDVYPTGSFAVQAKPNVRKNVVLVEGLFQDTLPLFLQQHPGPVSFLHIDCDLYSSTQTVLQALASRIQPNTIIVFDEFFNYPGWQGGECKAFLEFVQQYGFSFEYIGYCRYDKQVAVKLLARTLSASQPV